MAADVSELEEFSGDTLVQDIVRMQAFIRGHIVRKQMKEIQKLYEEIVHDIEGPEIEVVWSPGCLSLPVFRKLRKVKSSMVDQSVAKNNINQSACQSAGSFGSARMDQTSAPVDPPVHAPADKDMTEVALGLVSTEVQTEASLGVLGMLEHASDFVEYSPQHNQTTTGKPPDNKLITSTNKVCTRAQEDGPDMFSSCLHKNSTSNPSRNCTSCECQAGKDRTNKSFHSSASLERISPSRHMLPERLVHDNFDNKISSEKVQPEKLVHEPVESVNKPISGDGRMERDRHKPQEDTTVFKGVSGIRSGVDTEDVELPNDKEQLLQLKNTVVMELLWVQQAMNSRKHYLKLKEQLQ